MTLYYASNVVRRQIGAQDAEAWGVGFTMAKQEGKSKPCGRGSIGLGELGFDSHADVAVAQRRCSSMPGQRVDFSYSMPGIGCGAGQVGGSVSQPPAARCECLRGVAQEFHPGDGSYGL